MSERPQRYLRALAATALIVAGGTQVERYVRRHVGATTAEYVETATIALLGLALVIQALYVFRPADRQAAENERRLNEAQAVAAIGSWDWDVRTHQLTWSDHQYRLLGAEPGQLTPSLEAYLAFVHPDDRAQTRALMTGAVDREHALNGQHRITRRDGRVRTMRTTCQVMRNANGAAVKVIGATQDITDREEMAEALRLSDERFHLASRATSDALCDWTLASGATWWNEGFCRLFGYDPADGSTIHFWIEHIHPDDREATRTSLDQFLESPQHVWSGEYRFRRADGSFAWVFDRRYAVRTADGLPERVIGSMMDITTRKEAERMKSDFVSFASHQLRTPLAGLNWMLELANDCPTLPEDARAYISDARESAHRLVSLVNDLLDISRLESGHVTMTLGSVDLRALTEAVVQETKPLADARTQRLTFAAEPTKAVHADAQMLRQVITNLVSNAIKYTPPAGAIDIRLETQDGYARWSVQDTGIGIPPDARPRLFEKFYRAANATSIAAEGTGLGLHLVRLVLEQFGGRIWYESELSRGSTFVFVLPTEKSL